MLNYLATITCSVALGVAALTCQAEDIANSTVEKFAHVEQQVNDLRVQYIEKSLKTNDQTEANKIFQEAEDKMAKLIEQSGLKVPEYNAVALAARQDPQLRQRIQAAQ